MFSCFPWTYLFLRFVEPFAGQVKIGAEGVAARKGQFSGQNLLIGDLLTLTNTHLKFSSFDDHRFGVKENNSIRATFWIQFEDSGTSPDELLHFMFLTCHIPISSPVKISLTWVGCILSLSLWSNPCSHFPGVPLLLLLTGHGGVQPYLCDFLFLQCSLWLLFSSLWLSVAYGPEYPRLECRRWVGKPLDLIRILQEYRDYALRPEAPRDRARKNNRTSNIYWVLNITNNWASWFVGMWRFC